MSNEEVALLFLVAKTAVGALCVHKLIIAFYERRAGWHAFWLLAFLAVNAVNYTPCGAA
jgi:hypothetical protein